MVNLDVLDTIFYSMGLFACIAFLVERFFPGWLDMFLMGSILIIILGLGAVMIYEQRAQVVNKNQAEQD